MQSLKRIVLCAFIVMMSMLFTSCSTDNSPNSTLSRKGNNLMNQAELYEQSAYYIKAGEYYELARKAFLKEGNQEQALLCKWKATDMKKITVTYNISQDKLFDAMKLYNESYTQEDLNTWVAQGRLVHMMIDGEPWYFGSCFANLSYAYPEVMKRDAKLQATIDMFAGLLLNFLNNHLNPDVVYSNPRQFEGTQTIEVPRSQLPKSGKLRIWLPFPIETDSQANVEIISITPEKYHKQGPDIHADIGCVYFEIPLGKLKTDLNIEVKFRFTRYETRYHIDPAKVGTYDKNSELYKKYTGESENLVITPEIRQTALEITGEETNPYLQVQLINRYMLENIKYGYFPFNALEGLGEPATVYVHEKRYGDCGGQAIYFAALCRAVGIPARTTGGKELIVPGGSSHLWAEYYLPDYGWVPVDPSLRVVAALSRTTTPQEREMLEDYLGGNLDPFRLTFQNDADLNLIPAPNEPVVFRFTFQTVKAECPEMEEMPTAVIGDHYQCKIEQINP